MRPPGILERCTGELRQSRHIGYRNQIDMIELDVRTSKDGEMVLMHDATIERTTNGTGKVSELNYKELLSYNLYHDGALTEEKYHSSRIYC